MLARLFKQKKSLAPILTDMHSHILPALDDGAKSMEESIDLIKGFIDLGYKKLIATPHVMQDYYPNTAQSIREKRDSVKAELEKKSLAITIEASAEYYLDEYLLEAIHNGDELLLIGQKYILFEMSFM
ncbi:MAG: capsular biosynthesis protein, partial [Cyclobacteriaceae bacterium]|nr:capsular biosynthesis protein [Cyclobacteriaceae bacterium]